MKAGAEDVAAYPSRPGAVSVEPLTGAHERWSPVRFSTATDVEPEELAGIFEAARWAPSSFGEEPWRFIVARRDDPWRESVEEALSRGNGWARRASVLVVGVAAGTYVRDGRPNRHGAHDLGLALAALLAEAKARGLAAHPMAGIAPDRVRAAFAVPDDFEVLWVTAVGHHDPELDEPKLVERESRPRRRRPLDETVFGGRFGTPLEP